MSFSLCQAGISSFFLCFLRRGDRTSSSLPLSTWITLVTGFPGQIIEAVGRFPTDKPLFSLSRCSQSLLVRFRLRMNISSSSCTSTCFFFEGLDEGAVNDEGPGVADGASSDTFVFCFGLGLGRGRFVLDMLESWETCPNYGGTHVESRAHFSQNHDFDSACHLQTNKGKDSTENKAIVTGNWHGCHLVSNWG